MITPLTLENFENATDAEIIAAYVNDGETEDVARVYLAVLRNPDPRFVID